MSVIRCFQFWRGNILFQCSIDWGTLNKNIMGSRDGAVVEHLPPTQASHQCGPGSIPGLGVICGLSLLLVLVLARSERLLTLNKLQLQVRVHECFRFKGVKGRH